MKYYKVTVLKDLPDWKAGTTYGSISEHAVNEYQYCRMERDGKDVLELIPIAQKHPDFVKLELDENKTVKTCCPKCGSTKMFLNNKKSENYDDGVRYFYATVSMYCFDCGTEKDIYTFQTHSKVEHW